MGGLTQMNENCRLEWREGAIEYSFSSIINKATYLRIDYVPSFFRCTIEKSQL